MGASATAAAAAATNAPDTDWRAAFAAIKACLHAPCAVPSVGTAAAAATTAAYYASPIGSGTGNTARTSGCTSVTVASVRPIEAGNG